ncbi:hypothetical protein CANARDRAFT_28833 [[Candida] arabinofermentans NRRL YB-2248]|uniref:Uncharacterized protein n=1 Tax=[Candida] arabinofermentans NRRL YB-2248 TaxID=983967 RepID=A0A1E4SYW4_9ASCO|nr:hypothetical protein CANARDRAFT_28833 [[Candida] arabinofermentans NRRL YB-2248]
MDGNLIELSSSSDLDESDQQIVNQKINMFEMVLMKEYSGFDAIVPDEFFNRTERKSYGEKELSSMISHQWGKFSDWLGFGSALVDLPTLEPPTKELSRSFVVVVVTVVLLIAYLIYYGTATPNADCSWSNSPPVSWTTDCGTNDNEVDWKEAEVQVVTELDPFLLKKITMVEPVVSWDVFVSFFVTCVVPISFLLACVWLLTRGSETNGSGPSLKKECPSSTSISEDVSDVRSNVTTINNSFIQLQQQQQQQSNYDVSNYDFSNSVYKAGFQTCPLAESSMVSSLPSSPSNTTLTGQFEANESITSPSKRRSYSDDWKKSLELVFKKKGEEASDLMMAEAGIPKRTQNRWKLLLRQNQHI